MARRWIRVLIVVAIGVPLLVEALTFAGLVNYQLGGGDGAASTPTERPIPRVGVGDELLPGTPQLETVTAASIKATSPRWTLRIAVGVRNTADGAYELRLSAVTLGDGTTVDGGGSTGRIPAEANGTVTGRWEIPQGSTPRSVEVIGVAFGGDSARTTRADVRLAKVPVEGV